LGVPTPWFALYKAFARECTKALKPVRNKLVHHQISYDG
jgi:hypothetical protein